MPSIVKCILITEMLKRFLKKTPVSENKLNKDE